MAVLIQSNTADLIFSLNIVLGNTCELVKVAIAVSDI